MLFLHMLLMLYIFIDCMTTRLSLSPPTISTLSTHLGLSLLPPNRHYLQVSNCYKLGNNLCGPTLQRQALPMCFHQAPDSAFQNWSKYLAWTAWACAEQHTRSWYRGDNRAFWIACHCAFGRSTPSMNTVQYLVCTKMHCGLPLCGILTMWNSAQLVLILVHLS